MTTIRFRVDGNAIVMDVRGHAGFAELGKDPVCAGASILAMTVAQCIDIMRQEDKLRKKPHMTIRNGRVYVTAVPKPEAYAEALHVFWTGQIGMLLLAKNYPGHVEIVSTLEAGPGDEEGKAQESGTDSI